MTEVFLVKKARFCLERCIASDDIAVEGTITISPEEVPKEYRLTVKGWTPEEVEAALTQRLYSRAEGMVMFPRFMNPDPSVKRTELTSKEYAKSVLEYISLTQG